MLIRIVPSTWKTAVAANLATELHATATAITTQNAPPVPRDTIPHIILLGGHATHARCVGLDFMWHTSALLPKTQFAILVIHTRVHTMRTSTRGV